MDPWNNSKSIDEACPNEFEDNFVPEITKLPDSEKYLAILEEKLTKIKSNPNVMEQLAKKREECLNQLLSEPEYDCSRDLSLDEPIESTTIMRTIMPQKQALTQGEIVELLKYDRLENPETDSPEEKKNGT
ncbi:hypothetical protein AMK59_3564 [Oryctes borbonicus]|uniref:Uncharacterized protein n=1 Tax=Oryctes borbonicus TaxID=1629725 RepID=A0A0T6B9L3_9SCAR|nr:hypothetical protein AMK59_3564 [Oryctes borbonicus]